MRAKHQKTGTRLTGLAQRAIATGALFAMLFSCVSSQAMAVSVGTDVLPALVTEANDPTLDPDTDPTIDPNGSTDPDTNLDTDLDGSTDPDTDLDGSTDPDTDLDTDADRDDKMLDDEEFLVAPQKSVKPLNVVAGTYYYYVGEDGTGGFYEDEDHTSLVDGSESMTMAQFITANAPTAIYMDSTYTMTKGETWNNVTFYCNNENEDMFSLDGSNGGTLRLEDVTIDGNSKTFNKQVVSFQQAGSLLIMDGSTIQNFIFGNNSDGMIYVPSGFSARSEISVYGTITKNQGDAYLFNLCNSSSFVSFNQNASITNNDVKGVAYVHGAKLLFSGGTFDKNRVSNEKNAAFVFEGGSFDFRDGLIRDTTSDTSSSVWEVVTNGTTSIRYDTGNVGRCSFDNGVTLAEEIQVIDLKSLGFSGSEDIKIDNLSCVYLSGYNSWNGDYAGRTLSLKSTYLYPDSEGKLYIIPDTYILGYIRIGTQSVYLVETSVSTRSENNTIPLGEQAVAEFATDYGFDGGKDSASQRACRIQRNEGASDWKWVHDKDADGNAIPNAYTPTIEDVGKKFRVYLNSLNAYSTIYYEEFTVAAPQLSITVPTTLTVTVSPDGTCTLNGSNPQRFDDVGATIAAYAADNITGTGNGTITNNSSAPIYLTGVTFTWNTAADATAGTPAPSDIFTNWQSGKPELSLAVNGRSQTGTPNTDGGITWTPNAKIAAAVNDSTGTDLAMTWSFDLGGNSISQALDADVEAAIGTITYTVSMNAPSNHSLADDSYPVYDDMDYTENTMTERDDAA